MTNIGALKKPSVAGRAVSEVREYSGLCTSCERRADCVFSVAVTQPVVFCEEFTEERVTQLRDDENHLSRMERSPHSDSAFQGLCRNCDNRGDCMHDKTAEGMVYCEDYE